jgi:hypothetical protein
LSLPGSKFNAIIPNRLIALRHPDRPSGHLGLGYC